MKLLCKTFILTFTFFSFICSAIGSGQFNYAGVTVLNNSYDELDLSPQIEASQLSTLEYEDNLSDEGFRIIWGHQFNNYIAFEVGFTSFGTASFTATDNETDIKGEFSTTAGDIRAVGTYPINNSLFLKAQVGLVSWDNETDTLVDNGSAVFDTEKQTNKGNSLLTGVGIGYGFNRNVAVAFDFEKTEIDKITTENLGLSLLLRF
jgi:hypothetical protein